MKKLATILALTAVVANLGVSAAFAQMVTGTQDIDCETMANSYTDNLDWVPNNFQIGTGSRFVESSNDTSHVGTENSAYFDEAIDLTYADLVDAIVLKSNTPFSCGGAGRQVTLSIEATPFENLGDRLLSYGVDGVVDGGDDYYAAFSVVSPVPACTGVGCTLAAPGANEVVDTAFTGNNVYFAGATGAALNGTADDLASQLTSVTTGASLGQLVLYDAPTGFEGQVPLTLDFNLALPANLVNTGTFTSEVSYTLTV